MGRRRRRVVKIVKKKLPTVFTCPSCSQDSIKVSMPKGFGKAVVTCASCGLKDEIEVPPSFDMVDAYCAFTDKFYYGTTKSSEEVNETREIPKVMTSEE